MWSQDKYNIALKFASNAHKGQKVTGTDLPYITHPVMVCQEVKAACIAEKKEEITNIICMALLHDVLEDCDVTESEILKHFGKDVLNGVKALSKNPSLKTSEKMGDSIARIKATGKDPAIVKLADRISNLQEPPAFWTLKKRKEYADEAEIILSELGFASNYLAKRLKEKITNYRNLYIR